MTKSDDDFNYVPGDSGTRGDAGLALAPIDFLQIEIAVPEARHPVAAEAERAAAPTAVDAIGCSAPLALLRLREAMLGLERGDSLVFHAEFPGIAEDLAAVARIAGVKIEPADLPDTYTVTRA